MRSYLTFVCLLSFVLFALCQYDAGQGSIQAQLCTDPNNPLRCQYSVSCVADITQCPINNCSGVTPFLCSDFVTCVHSSSDCNCKGVICSDGSCKSDFSFCPLLEGCSELFPKRCGDGSCQLYNSDCFNHTGQICPSGLTRCIDGICRIAANCTGIPYAGCPVYQCPNGSCVNNYSSCLCPTDSSKVLCFDGTCTLIETPCAHLAPAFVTPMNQTYTVNTSSSNSITMTIATTSSTSPSSSLGTVTVQSSSVTPASGSYSLVTVKGAPGSVASSVTTPSSLSSTNVKTNLASPAVTVSTPTSQTSVVNASISLNVAAGVPVQNLCIGLVNDTTNVISCVPGTTTVTKRRTGMNTLSAPITHLGTYAIFVMPSCQPDGSQSGNDFCANQNWGSLGSGYYCAANGAKFYQCYHLGTFTMGALQPCAPGTSCKCCANSECSVNNTQSPCTAI